MTVFLVEDEIIVREGIRKNIDWTSNGFTFLGEAGDGELAYPMIQELKPDILITDIKMPFMDGLELSRMVRRDNPDIKILILSGYDEFEHAREAISIGVTEYLLKPVSGDRLLEAVCSIRDEIERERSEKRYIARFRQEMRELEQLERKRFFNRLVAPGTPVTDLLEQGRALGLELSARCYSILLLMLTLHDPESAPGEGQELLSESLNQLEQELAEEDEGISFRRNTEGFAVLFRAGSEDLLREARDRCVSLVTRRIAIPGEIDYFIAIGPTVQRLTGVHQSFSEANRIFAYRFFMEGNRVLHAGEQHRPPDLPDMDIDLSAVDASRMDNRFLEQFLRSGSEEGIPDFLDTLFRSMGPAMDSMLFRQYIVLNISFALISFVESLGRRKTELYSDWDNLRKMSRVFQSRQAADRFLTGLLHRAIELRNRAASDRYHTQIQTARQYIDEHYREDLSLNDVAAVVSMSPSYFSTVFSQHTGSTFIEYLTSVRMERARELLRTSSRKMSEIAYEAGYRDAHYFSHAFKKVNGITPREYRMGKEGMRE